MNAPQIRLALSGGGTAERAALARGKPPASLLVSYAASLTAFLKWRSEMEFRSWVLDSGAFSAYNSGTRIDLGEYIETCKQLLATDPTLEEVFSLDVIGDWRQSLQNVEAMWKAGVPAIPTFHYGSPEEALKEIAASYPKIALGGVARVKTERRTPWIEQCFARVWPKKIHGFGVGDQTTIMRFPFHSADATTWYLQPVAFGMFKLFPRDGHMPIRKVTSRKVSLRSQVDYYLDLETRAQKRWRATMEDLP